MVHLTPGPASGSGPTQSWMQQRVRKGWYQLEVRIWFCVWCYFNTKTVSTQTDVCVSYLWNQSYGLIIIPYAKNIVEKSFICVVRRKRVILAGYLVN